MRRPLVSIAVGAVLLIMAVAGFVIAPEHAPGVEQVGRDQFGNCQAIGENGNTCHYIATGLSQTLYDVVRIATWGLLIVGVLLAVVGLIHYGRR
jgi:hypothetical protein